MEAACGYDEPMVIHPFAFRTHAHTHGKARNSIQLFHVYSLLIFLNNIIEVNVRHTEVHVAEHLIHNCCIQKIESRLRELPYFSDSAVQIQVDMLEQSKEWIASKQANKQAMLIVAML
jgi:hypothetical protein